MRFQIGLRLEPRPHGVVELVAAQPEVVLKVQLGDGLTLEPVVQLVDGEAHLGLGAFVGEVLR